MPVSIDATGTEQKVVGPSASFQNYTGLTTTSTANAILFLITTSDSGGGDTITSVVWDPTGVNQTMTEVPGSPLTDNWGGNTVNMRMFGLVRPNSFGMITIRVNFSGSPDSGLTAVALSFRNAEFSSVANCFTNFASLARAGQTESSIDIASAEGNIAVAMHALGANVTGTNQTTIFTDTASVPDTAANRAAGDTSVTLTASMGASSNIDVIGVNVEASAAPLSARFWPNPMGRVHRLRPDWQDRFKLPLQQVLPFRQTEWPVPKGRLFPLELRTLADYALPIEPPIRALFPLYDWPNPRGPLYPVFLRTWIDTFKLPLQGELPPRQLDWPNPRGPLYPSILRVYFASSLPNEPPEPPPPTPPASFVPPPNPVGRAFPVALRTWTISTLRFIGQDRPGRQTNWPNPVRAKRDINRYISNDLPDKPQYPPPPVAPPILTLARLEPRVRFLESEERRVRFLSKTVIR